MKALFPVEIIGAAAMREFGAQMGSFLKSGDVVALIGDLGAGKTHLVQGIAHKLGYHGEVTSPTFALVNEYLVEEGKGTDVFHFDVYRLEHLEHLLEIGWEDYLERDGVVVIEWADKFPELIPEGAWCVAIEHVMCRKMTSEGVESLAEGRRLICELLVNS